MPPPKLPAHLDGSRRPEPLSNVSAQRIREEDDVGPQLSALLAASQRLEQSFATSAASLQEMRGEVQTLRTEIQSLRDQVSDIPLPGPTIPQPLFEPTPPPILVKSPRGSVIPMVIAAFLLAGVVAASAVLWSRQHQQQQDNLVQLEQSSQALAKAVEKLGTVSQMPAPAAVGANAVEPPPSDPTAGSHGPGEGDANKAATTPPVCPPPPEPVAAVRPKVLLPNLVGLRLGEARTAVAPLQLQLLPTDKRLKEASKIGWQSPNPGAELEPEEAVTVSLKPPIQKKKKKHE